MPIGMLLSSEQLLYNFLYYSRLKQSIKGASRRMKESSTNLGIKVLLMTLCGRHALVAILGWPTCLHNCSFVLPAVFGCCCSKTPTTCAIVVLSCRQSQFQPA